MMLSTFLQIPNAGGVTQAATTVADTAHQLAAQAAGIPQQPTETSLSLWELVVKGGPIMVPIGIMFLIAVFFFIERLLVLMKAQKTDANLMPNVKSAIQRGDLEAAKAFCRNSNTPQSRVVEKGISRIGNNINDIKADMDDVGMDELYKLEKNLSALSITARIAPMLGFIGTIAGVIKIFYDISLADNISIGLIAGGLYQKMITSAGGLVVGVIAFIGYHWLNTFVDKSIHNMNKAKMDLIDVLMEPGK